MVSVIVPVYNVERYVGECVDSILTQSYRDIEVILVDDGSTDSSGAICDGFASEESRVVVFHKENGGLSDARNFGLARSHGEWISFVDSDDWVSPVFIESLLKAALDSGCDIAAIPFGKQFKDGEGCGLTDSIPVKPVKHLAAHDVQRLMLYQVLDTGAQWRLYRRELLGVDPFPVGMYYEDLASIYRIIHRVDQVAVCDCRNLYAYRMRRDSIIRQDFRHIKAESALLIAKQLYGDISSWYPDLSAAAASRCFSLCRMVYGQVPIDSDASEQVKADRAALWGVVAKFRATVLGDSAARKRERLAAAIACFGETPFSMFCRVCRKVGLMQ